MSHWKKKIAQFSLAGKGSLLYKNARQSPKIGYVGPEVIPPKKLYAFGGMDSGGSYLR